MKFTKLVMLTTAVSTALTLATGTGHAAPQADSPEAAAINYTATRNDTNMVINTDAGSLAVEDGVFKIKAADGTTVAGTELNFRVDDFVFPITAELSGRTATLTPRLDVAHATYQPVALPFEDKAPWKNEYDREVAAWSRLGTTISLGASIATLVGGIGGGLIGCAAGAVLGAVATGVLATLFGLGPLGGCIAGAAAVGFIGTLAGQIFITAPIAIAAAIQYFTTINQPFNAPAK
ncbi:hypothetical protein [Nocardia inohanensis]|uniref:hypothetical protein n=1 Tax=Nocardia inohanensis TaxID=209246 RepID=UPI00082E5E40|nr:hypothetical protein [Nocardia inohanensis]